MSSEAAQALARILSMPLDIVRPPEPPPPPPRPRPESRPRAGTRLQGPRPQQRLRVLAAIREAAEPVTAAKLAKQLGLRRRHVSEVLRRYGISGEIERAGHTRIRGSYTYLWRAAS